MQIFMQIFLSLVMSVVMIVATRDAQAETSPDIEAGKARYLENCVNCHGQAGKGMASFPSIQGREAQYIAKRLTQYRAGEQVGPNSAIMISLAADLSDDDIANLAAYIARTFP